MKVELLLCLTPTTGRRTTKESEARAGGGLSGRLQAAGPRPHTCPSCGTSKEEQPRFPHGGSVSESKSRTEKIVARNNPGCFRQSGTSGSATSSTFYLPKQPKYLGCWSWEEARDRVPSQP